MLLGCWCSCCDSISRGAGSSPAAPGESLINETGAGERERERRPGEGGGGGLHPTMASSHLYDELRVGVGEALKLVLVQVHDEELVCGRQLHGHLGELLVEVADVAARFLPTGKEREGELVI